MSLIILGTILMLILKWFLIRCEKWNFILTLYRGRKIYEFIADRLFFNIIIRFLLEGYLEFAIDSMINMKSVNKEFLIV